MSESLKSRVDIFEQDVQITHELVNGNEDHEVETENGPLRSFAHLQKDLEAALGAAAAITETGQNRAAAEAAREGAEEAQTTAELARDAALTSSAIFPGTAAGLAATSTGEYFSTPSAEADDYLILYLNDAGSAVEQQRYPSLFALELVVEQLAQVMYQAVAAYDIGAQAAREIPDSRLLEQLIQQIGAAHDLAGQAAKAVAGGDALLRGGSAAEPSVSPLGDRDTGLYFPAADAIALAVAGLEALRVDPNGRLGIGTTTPSSKLDVDDDRLRLRQAHTPASATATGSQGDIAWDADYLYVCTATNTWKRAALTSW